MKRKIGLTLLAVLGLGAGLGFGLKSVLAEGIPSPNPLYYSGTLTENGSPVNGTRAITVYLWLNAAPTTGETALCTTSVTGTPIINGRFRIALDGSCKGAVNANPNAYEEVVDNGTSLGRSKIGAVPYAAEADHAVSATEAVDGGGIALAISRLQSSAHAASAFRAHQTAALSIPYGSVGLTVAFDSVEYDLASEYSTSTGVFSPREGGIYFLTCVVEYESSVVTSGDWFVDLFRNSTPITGFETNNSGQFGVSVATTATVQLNLNAGDSVRCVTAQANNSAATSLPLVVGASGSRNYFSGARLF